MERKRPRSPQTIRSQRFSCDLCALSRSTSSYDGASLARLRLQSWTRPLPTRGIEPFSTDAAPGPVELVTNIAQVAERLTHTARFGDGPSGRPEPEASGRLAEQLAEIAEGIAKVTSTLSEERRDADLSLSKERRVADRIIV